MEKVNKKKQSKKISSSDYSESSVFSTVFNNNKAIMLLIDPQNNQQIIDVNETAIKFYGYTREEFLSLNMGQINTISEEERHMKMKEAIKKPHSYFHFIHKTSTGSTKDVEIQASPIVYKKKKVMFIIVHDITDHQRTEKELNESRDEYRNLGTFLQLVTDNIPDLLWAKDLEGGYTFANEAICTKLLRVKKQEEVLGKTDLYFAEKERSKHPLNPNWHTFGEVCVDSDAIVLETNRIGRFEEYGNVEGDFLFLDVIKVPMRDESGNVIGTIGSARDITEQIAIESKLKESEERLGLALAGSGLGIWDEWVQTGELHVDERWAEIIGYTLEELFPISVDTWRCHTHPDDLKESERKLQKCFNKEIETYECELRMKHKDGTWIWIMDRGKVFEWDENGKPVRISGTHLDITERKQAEFRIAESEKRYRSFFEGSPLSLWEQDETDVIIYLDEQIKSRKMDIKSLLDAYPDIVKKCVDLVKIIDVNPATLKLYNAHSKEDLLWSLSRVFTEESYITFKNELIYIYNKESIPTRESTNKLLDGRVINVLVESALLSENRYIKIVTNITEQKAIELKLVESEERLGLALAGSGLGIWDVCVRTGELHVDERWAEIIGYKLEEILPDSTKFWRENCHPDDLIQGDLIQEKYLRKEIEIFKCDIRMKHKNGNWIWIQTQGKIFEWAEDGEPLRMSGTHLDITDRKQAEFKIAESENKFRSYFESSPLSLWEQDYSQLILYLKKIRVNVDTDIKEYLDSNPEIVKKCSKMIRTINVNNATVVLYEANEKENLLVDYEVTDNPESFEVFKKRIISIYRNEVAFEIETEHMTFKGKKIKIRIESILLNNYKVLTTITDITELKNKETELENLLAQSKSDSETKEILLREINHRVKNNLSSFIGMLYAEKKQSENDRDIVQMEHIDSLINRIKGISIAHEMLSRSQWAAISVFKLTEKILHSLNHLIPKDRVISIKLIPSDIFLDADQSHSIAIIINELFSNTIKHAIRPGEKIKVKIGIQEKNGTIIFIYNDSGPGYPEELLNSEFKNVGMYLIKNIVEQSLRGVMRIFNRGGAVVEIEFPGGSTLEEL